MTKKPLLKIVLSLLFTIVCSQHLQAQVIDIYYNLFNDDLSYKDDGVLVEIPKIKQGDEVVLHLTEFNNYLYTIELEITQEHLTDKTGAISDASLMSGLIPGLPMPGFGPGGNDLSGGGTTGLLDIPLININDNPISLTSLFGGSRGSTQILEQLESTTSEISNLLVEMDQIAEEVKSLRKTATVSRMAEEYVEVLKTHPNLKSSFIKEMCREYYQSVFRKNPDEGIQLEDVLKLQDDGIKYRSLMTDLKARQSSLGNKVSSLEGLTKQYRSFEIDDQAYQSYDANLTKFLQQSKALHLQLESGVMNDVPLEDYPSISELTNLQLKLAEIINNDFTYHSRIKVTGDHLAINIKVVKLSDQVNGESEILKSRWLHFETKGGLKITGSVGLNFSQFFDPSQSYSTNNGIIVSDDDGAFAPTVTSFIHFYSYSGKKTSIGGSFGIGFPLAGSGDNQALQFFAGPSLIFGAAQRIILNFGLTGGRATRLSKGFKVGDEFDVNTGDIPTRNPYEIGFYIGASFNLGGN